MNYEKLNLQCLIQPLSTEAPIKTNGLLEESLASLKVDSIDLAYRYSLHASVGINDNDDVFLPDELWNARFSPKDKKLDWMHDELAVIGHITDVCVKDWEGNDIDIELESFDRPFDLYTELAIYTYWKTKERTELFKDMLEKVDSGELAVSMEVIFPTWDFLVQKDNKFFLIKKTPETEFLTAHLRMKGGSGEYNGNRIYRVLREMIFTGQGIVTVPANKRSKFLPREMYLGISSDIIELSESSFANNIDTFFNKESQMTENEIASMKEAMAKMETELAAMKEACAAAIAEKEAYASKLEQMEASMKEAMAAAKTAVEEVQAEKAKAEEMVKSEAAKAKTALEEAAAYKAEIDKIKVESALAARVNNLVKAGVAEDKAKDLVSKFSTMTEEQFASIHELAVASVSVVKPAVQTVNFEQATIEESSVAGLANTNQGDESQERIQNFFATSNLFQHTSKGNK